MIAVGLLLGWRPTHGEGELLAAVALLLLLRFAVLWIGIFLGLVIPGTDAANAVATLLFPVTMVTSAFAPTESMPVWLGTIAEWNPLSSTIYAIRGLLGNPIGGTGSFVPDHAVALALAWPLALIAVFLPLALHRYRHLER